MIARKEKLRANLLRTISHDLRTPLTLYRVMHILVLNHYEMLDNETKGKQIFGYI